MQVSGRQVALAARAVFGTLQVLHRIQSLTETELADAMSLTVGGLRAYIYSQKRTIHSLMERGIDYQIAVEMNQPYLIRYRDNGTPRVRMARTHSEIRAKIDRRRDDVITEHRRSDEIIQAIDMLTAQERNEPFHL